MNYGVQVYYCSKACQQSDWKVHKKICGPKYDGTLDILGKMTLDGADGPSSRRVASSDEATKILRHRNAMQQVLQGLSGRSLPEMPTAEGIHGFDPRTGRWVNFGTGDDAFKAFLKTPKDRSGGRE